MPGRDTTDVCKLQENFHVADKTLYMPLVDLEKASDPVQIRVIWWDICKLGFEDWLVHPKESMYKMPEAECVFVAIWGVVQYKDAILPV